MATQFMATLLLEAIMCEAQRHAIIHVLRAHPEWTLEQLREYMQGPGPVAAMLGSVTVHELCVSEGRGRLELPADGGPPVQRHRLEHAKRATGACFDGCMREVLGEASRPVGAGYLRLRLGGPRWKLQASLRRLVARGVVERSGTTSATVYALRPGG